MGLKLVDGLRRIFLMKITDIRDNSIANANLGIYTEGYILARLVGEHSVIKCDSRFLFEVICFCGCERETLAKRIGCAFDEGGIEPI